MIMVNLSKEETRKKLTEIGEAIAVDKRTKKQYSLKFFLNEEMPQEPYVEINGECLLVQPIQTLIEKSLDFYIAVVETKGEPNA